tara:strand:- start:4045 stop:4263 length:219 start_codon:yes stop_codon:yes gene_type:complete
MKPIVYNAKDDMITLQLQKHNGRSIGWFRAEVQNYLTFSFVRDNARAQAAPRIRKARLLRIDLSKTPLMPVN